ncbi:MAG TPA: hypothetical protein VFZ13_06910 [Gemmatimonadales bacterium]
MHPHRGIEPRGRRRCTDAGLSFAEARRICGAVHRDLRLLQSRHGFVLMRREKAKSRHDLTGHVAG